MLSQNDRDSLKAIVGERFVSTGESTLHLHSHDESYHAPFLPDVVVWPHSTAEVSRIVKYASERKIPITGWGMGTSLEGNPIPVSHGIVINFQEMQKILAIRREDFQVDVEAGVVYKELNKILAKDGLFFRSAAEIHPTLKTPVRALILQGVWSCVLALSGSYDALLTYVTFASLLFNALTVVGVLVLRRKRPDLVRPYRVPGYPITPLLFLAGAGFFTLYIFLGAPREALIGSALVSSGLPAYWMFSRRATLA